MHKSVLLEEAVKWLDPRPGGTVVDGTLGGGGHAKAILEQLGHRGRLIGLDKDPAAVRRASEALAEFGERTMILNDDFRNITKLLESAEIKKVDGMLLDLGVSSMQLDEAARGFSFTKDAALDMRMDPKSSLTAESIVNTTPQHELQDILGRLGEERFAGRIARCIVSERRRSRIRTTSQLVSVILHAVPAATRHGRIHAATRSFQALRIAINDELGALEEFLASALGCLGAEGKLVIIAFHSLEDRIVKNAFKQFQADGLGRVLTKKPVTPSEKETSENPRARSAKPRAFEKS